MKLSILLCFCALIYFSHAYVYKSAEFNSSLNAWRKLHPSCYTYTVVNIQDDVWNGPTVSRTTIKVQKNKVVSRSYQQTQLFHSPNKVLTSWKETTNDTIGSHGGDYASNISPAVTLDKIYSYCHDSILTKDQDMSNGVSDSNIAEFEVFNNSVIAYCSFKGELCDWPCGGFINIERFSTC